jgi:putative ABC transport system substrate-binding protein
MAAWLMAFPCVSPVAFAQAMSRLGVLLPGSPPSDDRPAVRGFKQGLRELGYVDGQNVIIEYRWAEGKPERYPELIADLVRLRVDVIFAFSTAALPSLAAATKEIPVVLASMNDPVKDGYAKSLARPGGNVTGMTLVDPELHAKRLQILAEAVPGATRIALVRNPHPGAVDPDVYRTAAIRLGITLQLFEVRNATELEQVFPILQRSDFRAVMFGQDPLFSQERRRIAELSLRHRLPTLSGETGFAEAGGLMDYGPSLFDNFRRVPVYIDKILKGAKPADLPIEQPRKLELVINLKTAKALGITVPQSLLIRADEVIQ